MKKFLIIFFIPFFSFLSIAESNNKISYIDIEKVLSTSKPGVSLIDQLQEINKKNNEKFNKNGELLKNKETKLISQKNVISDDAFKDEIKKLQLEVKNYNDNRKKVISNFNKIKIKNTNNLIKLINPILKDYADKNSISIILQKKNIVMGKNEFDITDKIIEIVNLNIKEFKIK
jgi:outer membrane protein